MGFQINAMSVGNGIGTVPADVSAKEPAPKAQEPVIETAKTDPELIKKTASELQDISLAFNRRLKFIIDPDSKQILIKVIDRETDKVIKVLPPEELQRFHSRIRDTIGVMFDEWA